MSCGCRCLPLAKRSVRHTDDLCEACHVDVYCVLTSLVELVAARHPEEAHDDDDAETCSSRSPIVMPCDVCDGLPDWDEHDRAEQHAREEETRQNTEHNINVRPT